MSVNFFGLFLRYLGARSQGFTDLVSMGLLCVYCHLLDVWVCDSQLE